jgi:hypothetical protein
MRKLRVPYPKSLESKRHSIIETLYRFEALAKLNQYYFVKNTREICLLSDALEGIPSFELQD